MTEIRPSRLQTFPIAWFAMIMGLGGLTLAWSKAEQLLNLPLQISPYLLALSTLLFFCLSVVYAIKIVRFRAAAGSEWNHPVKMSFVPTFSVALLVLATAWLEVNPAYSRLLWLFGASIHLVLTLHILSQWIQQPKFELLHLNPAWFIPVMGNILVPIAGVYHAPIWVSWFFFSIGIVFWPLLLTIIFYRVIFHGSLPERLLPTLFILIAPPSVGFVAYLKLTGQVDVLANILYFSGLFFTLLLFVQVRSFLRLRFYLSWWAYSFPLAAITVASLSMFHYTGEPGFLHLSGLLLGIATAVIAGLFARTVIGVLRKEICVEE